MPNITINDETMTMEPGERLLDVARRNAAHIGFVCDGNGLCQMCECTVQSGMDNLSPTSESEETWLTQQQLEHGKRLACQASLRGSGSVTVVTRAEELRQQANELLNPPEDTNRQEHLSRLVDNLMVMSIEHIKKFPQNMMYTMVGCFSLRPTFRSAGQAINDTWRITWRVATGRKLETVPFPGIQQEQEATAPAAIPAETASRRSQPAPSTPPPPPPPPPEPEPEPNDSDMDTDDSDTDDSDTGSGRSSRRRRRGR